VIQLPFQKKKLEPECLHIALINGNKDHSAIYFHSGRVAVVTPKGGGDLWGCNTGYNSLKIKQQIDQRLLKNNASHSLQLFSLCLFKICCHRVMLHSYRTKPPISSDWLFNGCKVWNSIIWWGRYSFLCIIVKLIYNTVLVTTAFLGDWEPKKNLRDKLSPEMCTTVKH